MDCGNSAKLKIIPFSEIWFDCRYNMVVSILQTKDYNFHYRALENAYQYIVEDVFTQNGTNINLLECKVENNVDRFVDEYVVEESENMKAEELLIYIFEKIKNGKYILAGVDLYNWIPTSMTYHKHHWQHYALITGIDFSNNYVYVLDAAKAGYKEYKIKIDSFIQCVYQSDYEYKLREIDVINNRKTYIITKLRIQENAKGIVESINRISGTDIWQLTDEDYDTQEYADLCAMYINRIMYRQKANDLLFETIEKQNIINKYGHFFVNAKKGWESIQINFMKNYFGQDRTERMHLLNEQVWNQLEDEMIVWEKICIKDVWEF